MNQLSGEQISKLNTAPRIRVTGTWYRHVPVRYREAALSGMAANGRWSRRGGFPVLYLGQPIDSVTVEAYRHLVDKVEGTIAQEIAPRVLVTCEVDIEEVLDLTTAGGRATAGLDLVTLESATNDGEAYDRCRAVAAAAHQLGMHGIITPAATRMGRTLALFPERLTDDEYPALTAETIWEGLPPDPRNGGRRLRVV